MSQTQQVNNHIFSNWQHLGQQAHSDGDLERAKDMYRAAKMQLRKLGTRDLALARLATDMARLYRDCGQIKRAEIIYKTALESFAATTGINSSQSATVLVEMAILALQQQKFRGARVTYERARASLKQLSEVPSQALLQAMLSLAEAYGNAGKADECLLVLRDIDEMRLRLRSAAR